MHVFFSFLVPTNYFLLVAMFHTITIFKSVNMNLNLRHHVDQVLGAALALSEELTGGFLSFSVHCLLELVRPVWLDAFGDRLEQVRMAVKRDEK